MSEAISNASEGAVDRPFLIRLEEVRAGFRHQIVLADVDLEVKGGDFLAIVGPNGAGKTTLLRTVLGILPPLAGRVRTCGRMGYSPQRSLLDPIFPFTAAEVVAMGLVARQEEDEELGSRQRREMVAGALESCGMRELSEHAFRDLSGGQRQRVLVARALVADPDVLVLDEPTNDLDLRGEYDVMELIRALHESGRTVVMVSHMLHVVARYAHEIALIHDRRLVSGPADEMLDAARLEAIYDMPVSVYATASGRVVAPGRGRPVE